MVGMECEETAKTSAICSRSELPYAAQSSLVPAIPDFYITITL